MALSVEKVLAHCTKIGEVAGVEFFEHPRGDDSGMIAMHGGRAVYTDWYDLPRECDILDGADGAAEFIELYA